MVGAPAGLPTLLRAAEVAGLMIKLFPVSSSGPLQGDVEMWGRGVAAAAAAEASLRKGHRTLLLLTLPARTFSRGLDRRRASRVRSQDQPAGIDPIADDVERDNKGLATLMTSVTDVIGLGGAVALVHPSSSYVWVQHPLLDARGCGGAWRIFKRFCRCGPTS